MAFKSTTTWSYFVVLENIHIKNTQRLKDLCGIVRELDCYFGFEQIRLGSGASSCNNIRWWYHDLRGLVHLMHNDATINFHMIQIAKAEGRAGVFSSSLLLPIYTFTKTIRKTHITNIVTCSRSPWDISTGVLHLLHLLGAVRGKTRWRWLLEAPEEEEGK